MLIYFVIICTGKYVSESGVFPLIKTEDNYLRMEVYIRNGFHLGGFTLFVNSPEGIYNICERLF